MRICFFCKIDSRKALDVIEFYKQDIDALKLIDPELKVVTTWRDIDLKADVIYVWWWTYAIYPVLLGKFLNKKVVITGAFHYDTPLAPIDFVRRKWWHKALIYFSAKLAYRNIYVSHKEYMFTRQHWNLKNALYSPHGIDIDKYLPGKEQRENFLFTIIGTSKFNVERKCLPQIISSAEAILREFHDYKILIGGRKGDGYDDMVHLIEQSNLTGSVVMLGELTEEEKIDYLQKCRMYLQPSIYEGFGLATAEAMACGAPVLSSKVGEVENVVGDSGILMEGHSSSEISNTVIKWLSNPNQLVELGLKGRARITECFPVSNRYRDVKEAIFLGKVRGFR